ncbi:MAG: sensor histidine kinase [Firmicutes bacterium]|nr:sensor histidine kinase [Bacillota bacterium]
MEKIKKSLTAKVAAFVLLQALIVAAVAATVMVGFNLELGWYDKSEQEVKQDIYHETASAASVQIADELLYIQEEQGQLEAALESPLDQSDKKEPLYGRIHSDQPEEKEILYGEREATGLAYHLRMDLGMENGEDKQIEKKLHPALFQEEAAYREIFDHVNMQIEICLFDLDQKDALPQNLQTQYCFYSNLYKYQKAALAILIAGVIGVIVLMIFLIMAVGHSKRETGLFPQGLPLDFMAALTSILLMALGALLTETLGYDRMELICSGLEVLGMSIALTGFVLIFAVNVKKCVWWKNTIIYRLLVWGKRIGIKLANGAWHVFKNAMKHLPMIWRTVLFLAAALLLNLITASNMYWDGGAVLLWLLEAIAVSICVIHVALVLKRLKEGGKRLAEGDLSYQIDKKGMWFDFAEHADDLNSIGKGMSKAIEERMKSEHFKAELITNVSHDIKTPLTSIINYVDFLKKEEIDNEKAQAYIEVLDRQSRRLKKLTEDLVDASKAATGNVPMQLAPCQIGVLMEQTMGEYKEKAEASDLRFIIKMPDEELRIMADGRRLWRVFDNLLGNICKYSQPGTRVYLDLKKMDGKAVIMYRNTSKYELNISEEELMERFVRGDSSRHTEGSGLGLSIARNLVELQGGNFQISIDGDLFKVIIRFDLLQEPILQEGN